MKPRVLVVDDSALSRRTLRQILEPAGYDVAEAEDGLSALERYFLEKPDVVLLDLVMKGMMGLDVLDKLHQLDPKVRAIVLSADIQDSASTSSVWNWIAIRCASSLRVAYDVASTTLAMRAS